VVATGRIVLRIAHVLHPVDGLHVEDFGMAMCGR
jgi:hypothetical protein